MALVSFVRSSSIPTCILQTQCSSAVHPFFQLNKAAHFTWFLSKGSTRIIYTVWFSLNWTGQNYAKLLETPSLKYKYHISNTSYYIMYIVPGNLTKHTLVLRGSITQGGRATSKLFLNKIPTTSNIWGKFASKEKHSTENLNNLCHATFVISISIHIIKDTSTGAVFA